MRDMPASFDATVGLASLGVADAARGIRAGSWTSVALTRALLDRIAAWDARLNVFITLLADRSLQQAAQCDSRLAEGGDIGRLHGVPIALKDCIDAEGVATTGGSPLFTDRIARQDAPLVAALKQQGAIILGKNTLNELCMSSGRTSYYGLVRNPWALDRATGGSSSGSCAGVAAGLFPAAIGTDTAGSIRNPASWCGVVGLKPSNGLVPVRGTIPLSPSLDVCGPITRNVEDAALLLGVMALYDPGDATSENHPAEDYGAALGQPTRRFRVGVPRGPIEAMSAGIAPVVLAAIEQIRAMVHSVIDVDLPQGGEAMALVPFGETYAWHEPYFKTQRQLYSLQDQATLDALANVPAAAYIRARQALDLRRRTADAAFECIDLLVFPTLPNTAPKLELVREAEPDPGLQQAQLPGLFNVLGLPVITIPCGVDTNGLPVGLSIAGPRFAESHVLAMAHTYEKATRWNHMRPALAG